MPIVIDTDFGLPPVDDSLAVALALAAPELDVLGITTAMGNQNTAKANTELKFFLEQLGRTEVPIYAGQPLPLSRPMTAQYNDPAYMAARYDISPAKPVGTKRFEAETASDYLVRITKERPGEVTIVALGPLTNLALAIRRDPDFAKRLKRIVYMGGYFAQMPGNGNTTGHSAITDFNTWTDPEAADVVMRSGATIEISPLNISNQLTIPAAMFRQLHAGRAPFAALLREFQPNTPELTHAAFGYFYDQFTIAALIDPGLRDVTQMRVVIETKGVASYGATVGDEADEEPAEWARGVKAVDVQFAPKIDRFYKLRSIAWVRPGNGRRQKGVPDLLAGISPRATHRGDRRGSFHTGAPASDP